MIVGLAYTTQQTLLSNIYRSRYSIEYYGVARRQVCKKVTIVDDAAISASAEDNIS